ncbi:MAG: hypothetical protein ACYSWX_08130 [Planctomycetota bacterium]|jgi:anti-sigma-K factor RskA
MGRPKSFWRENWAWVVIPAVAVLGLVAGLFLSNQGDGTGHAHDDADASNEPFDYPLF